MGVPVGEPGAAFGGVEAGAALGPVSAPVSVAANERYWRAAGIDHPSLRDGHLYPPIAANLTILLFQTVASRPLLHTGQRLTCHRRALAGVDLTVAGVVADRFTKRDREYAAVEAAVTLADGSPLWTSVATFCEVAREGPADTAGALGHGRRAGPKRPRTAIAERGSAVSSVRRQDAFDADALRAYSRRGNFHSEPAAAAELGLRGLVAQGMQVVGPAYGIALDAWGDGFLDHGELDLRFVGMVAADDVVETTVALDGTSAPVTVYNRSTSRTAVVGTMHADRTDR
jgi:acyl dehydratase